MTRRMILYEIGKVLLLLVELACVLLVGYSILRLAWFASQYILSHLSPDFLLQTVDSLPERVASSVLSDMRRRAVEEILCDVGLLNSVERYYTANRMEGLYRDCWVASQEIICGGVYAEDYTSHKIKVRGQWLTIRLNVDFNGTVILESRNTKNRFSHRGLAKTMVELEPDYGEFGQQFRCFADSPEDFRNLVTVEMAEKLMAMTEQYPDLCVIFRRGCIHVLIRRRSFDRRWELACPFCFPQLKREAHRLYGPLMDFTDMLLE